MELNRRDFLRSSSVAAAAILTGATARAESPPKTSSPATAPVDRRTDPTYLDQSIRHISDEDLFDSLDFSCPQLSTMHHAIEDGDIPKAFAAWGEHWQAMQERARFQDAGELLTTADLAGASFEERRAGIIEHAEEILAHRINGWGDVTIQHGPVVDFNASYGNSGKYGFHYWIWSRYLIQAYLLTKNQKYLAEFDALFNQWYEQRDQVVGDIENLDPIYYELGLGVRNRVFLEYYALPYEARPTQTHERMLKTMLGAARWLHEEESRMYRGGNWQIIGSYGLALIGLMVPDFKDASAWVRMGSDRLIAHTVNDCFADGCHRERVPSSYMLYLYRDPRNIAVLMNDRPAYATLAEELNKPLEKILNWYLYALPPDGYVPAINDGGRLLMPAALMQDGYDLFHRRDMLWIKKNLLGKDISDVAEKPQHTSMHFAPSGFTIMRSDWSADATYMIVNHGPSGGGHSHDDALSFEMNALGTAIAIDAGIGLTYDDPNHSRWYTQAKAHNVLLVDDVNPNRKEAEGRDVVWTSLKSIDYLAATHHGYLASLGVIHRRHLAFIKPDYFVIYDVVESTRGDHRLAWNLHTTMNLAPDARNPTAKGPGLMILPSDAAWKNDRSQGLADTRGIRGFPTSHSVIDWLSFHGKLTQGETTTFGVALLPYPDSVPNLKFATRRQTERASHFALESPVGIDHLLFGDIDSDGFMFRGAFAYAREREGMIMNLSMSQATHFAHGDIQIESKEPRDLEKTL